VRAPNFDSAASGSWLSLQGPQIGPPTWAVVVELVGSIVVAAAVVVSAAGQLWACPLWWPAFGLLVSLTPSWAQWSTRTGPAFGLEPGPADRIADGQLLLLLSFSSAALLLPAVGLLLPVVVAHLSCTVDRSLLLLLYCLAPLAADSKLLLLLVLLLWLTLSKLGNPLLRLLLCGLLLLLRLLLGSHLLLGLLLFLLYWVFVLKFVVQQQAIDLVFLETGF
jgi:hypothetical protein